MNPSPGIARPLALQLCALAALCLWPYALFQPWYLSLLGASLLAWRVLLALRGAPMPGLWLTLPIGLLGLALILLAWGIPVGRQPGLSALSLLLPLKLLETRRSRDVRATLLLAFFLILGMFLHEQSAIIVLAATLATLASLTVAALAQQPQLAPIRALRLAGGLLATGLPLMLALFILFPRIEGPLWGLPLDAYASTGLSERMQPGSISQLIRSGEIAFRASFEGDVPPPRDRYWRGPVLHIFDGREWLPRVLPSDSTPDYLAAGRSWAYTITLEPTQLRWLLALDYPTQSETGRFRPDFALTQREPVRQRQRYRVESSPDVLVGLDEDPGMLRFALQLPPDFNPRSLELGRQIAARHREPEARRRAVLDAMRSQRLQYTLEPPLTGRHSVDDFLFDTRRGFCEHFSAAFVVLMRAAGIPARVVTGYQGGEQNPVDGSLVVRQSDAHAWAEVWLEGQGWQRVDPTAESFPQRLDQDGLRASLPPGESLGVPFVLRNDLAWLRNLRHRWEAVGNAWNQWVLGYNTRRQAELLSRLGLKPDWQNLVATMAAAAGLWLAWLAWRLRPQGLKRDALDRLWLGWCRQLARRGLRRQPWESPASFAERAAARWPAQAATLRDIAAHYARLRYGPHPASAQDLGELRQRLRQLRIPRNA